MSEAVSDSAEIPPRGESKPPFFWVGNEVFDVFLPIMGADCFTIYAYFARSEFSNPKLKHSVRETANATKLGITTVSRSLEILEHLQLIKLIRFRGSKDSECRVLDAREVAGRLGARYDRKALWFSLPREVAQRLNCEVVALRQRQQGKSTAPDGSNLFRTVSQRSAGVSPAVRQRSARETQTAAHLLQEERRIEIIPTPTPSHDCEPRKPKSFPNEIVPDTELNWARAKLTGVVNDMKGHLLDLNRPLDSHLANGFTDWQAIGFNSMAVERVSRRCAILILTLSVDDPVASRRGLNKYHQKWDASVRKWYGDDVRVELIEAQRR